MQTGDVVRIHHFGPSSKVRDPCYAYVYNVDDEVGVGADLVILTGGYKVTRIWCGVGHTFHLPTDKKEREGYWAVCTPEDVPDAVYVEVVKRALLGAI